MNEEHREALLRDDDERSVDNTSLSRPPPADKALLSICPPISAAGIRFDIPFGGVAYC